MGVAGLCVGSLGVVDADGVVPGGVAVAIAVDILVLPVSVSVMPVVRSLWASLWFSASRTLLMLVVVGVGLCVGGQRLAFRAVVGFCGSVWGVCSRWCGLLVLLLV